MCAASGVNLILGSLRPLARSGRGSSFSATGAGPPPKNGGGGDERELKVRPKKSHTKKVESAVKKGKQALSVPTLINRHSVCLP